MSDYNEITAVITTEEPAVAATLDDLRYLVFEGKKGDTGDSAYEEAVALGFVGTEEEWIASLKGEKGDPGEDGVSFVHAYLDEGVVRYVYAYKEHEPDDIYTSTAMAQDIENGILPLLHYSPEDDVFDYFELDRYDLSHASRVVYFRSKDYLLSVDSTGAYTLSDRPQGGDVANAVLYTPQTLTPAQQEQARGNIGAGTYSKPSGGIPASDLANEMPFFELPSGGQSGQALLSDGADGAYWGQAQGGSGLTDSIKSALLACFRNVGWINDQGETFYQALYDALYPPANLSSISARFNQGSAKIYNTDSLDVLKPYLTVTAYYDNQTSGTITNYALSGLLSVGTSTITASYGGKSATFTVTVSEKGADIERTGNDLYIMNAGASKVGSTLVFS